MITRDQQPFWLAVLLVVGGGFLMATRTDLEKSITPILTMVVGFYYGRSSNGTNGNGNYPNGGGGK